MNMSHAVGLVLWPMDKERMVVACNLVKAAFEMGNPTDVQYGTVRPRSVNSEGAILSEIHRTRFAKRGLVSSRTVSAGINPLKDVSKIKMLLFAFLYKSKTGVSKFIAKLLVRRMASRVGVRRAADAAFSR
jgi:hypothetical protein